MAMAAARCSDAYFDPRLLPAPAAFRRIAVHGALPNLRDRGCHICGDPVYRRLRFRKDCDRRRRAASPPAVHFYGGNPARALKDRHDLAALECRGKNEGCGETGDAVTL